MRRCMGSRFRLDDSSINADKCGGCGTNININNSKKCITSSQNRIRMAKQATAVMSWQANELVHILLVLICVWKEEEETGNRGKSRLIDVHYGILQLITEDVLADAAAVVALVNYCLHHLHWYEFIQADTQSLLGMGSTTEQKRWRWWMEKEEVHTHSPLNVPWKKHPSKYRGLQEKRSRRRRRGWWRQMAPIEWMRHWDTKRRRSPLFDR